MEESSFMKAIANTSKIKLPNGFIGKITILLIFFATFLTFISIKANVLGLYIAVVAIIALLAFAALFLLTNFANKNPQAALLEGGEFIMHERIQLASKNNGLINVDNQNPMADPNSQIEIVDSTEAEKPDETENNGGN